MWVTARGAVRVTVRVVFGVGWKGSKRTRGEPFSQWGSNQGQVKWSRVESSGGSVKLLTVGLKQRRCSGDKRACVQAWMHGYMDVVVGEGPGPVTTSEKKLPWKMP